jgi:cAMP-dependent protein kinase regulator
MASIEELKQHGLALFATNKTLPALQVYDAIVAAQPTDYEARLRVADCLSALAESELANRVYRAVAWYAMKAGHPLSAVVIAKVLEASGDPAEDLLTGLVMHYGCDSDLIGKFAARIKLPESSAEVPPPDLQAGPGPDFVAKAAERAATCTDNFQEYPEALHSIPLLSGLSEDAFRRVLATVVVRRMADGQLAIREGEPGQSFFLVATGRVRVFDTDGLGRERDLALLGENAVFGEMALLSNQPRSASVGVVAEADLIELTRESLASLADELDQVATALHNFTRERLLSNLMARSPLFKPFSKVQQRDLLRRFTEHDVVAGTAIIHENDAGRGLFVVLSGELEVIKGEDTPLATLRTGEVFGEMALIRETETSASVSAVTPSTVLFLGKEYVDRMVAGVPEIRSYLETLAEDREMDTQLTLGSVGDEEEDGSVIILI